MPRPPSLHELARTLRLSRTTVSDALRGKGRVSSATIERVRKAAAAIGYNPNPLVSTVLASIKRGTGSGYRGALAMVDLHERDHWPHGPYSRELVAGAKARAAEMGFSIEEFVAGPDVLPLPRLDTILHSRGIHGVIVLPAWRQPDLLEINWSRYAGIYTDEVTAAPELHSVCSDHYTSMLTLLGILEQRGYQRPGLILQRGRDERIRYRQSAAYVAWQSSDASRDAVPPLIIADAEEVKTAVERWYRRFKPDVVLSHYPETPDWIQALDSRRSGGFVLLNVLNSTKPCAALDLQPQLLGARAAELVVGQILRGELGIPRWPTRSTVHAGWVEGPTVRPPPSVSTPTSARR
jgi:LacI family transcriptional regulator